MTPLQRALLAWYERNGRTHLPWRRSRDPYAILVSEFMLQQTQVDRVLPKFEQFMQTFPDVQSLARAGVADVLRLWKGLGYNSRAVRLREIAQRVVSEYGGRMPSDESELRSLSGIGPYTVAALRAFAFEIDDAAIDTNVRRVVHRVLYGLEHSAAVSNAQLDADAHAAVPEGRAHDWNSALMDFGSSLCTARAPKCLLCPLQSECRAFPVDAAALERARAANARKPSPQEALPFRHTTRFARGRIIDRLRELKPGERISLLDLHRDLGPHVRRSVEDLSEIVRGLERDGLVEVAQHELALRDA